jgi:hypothetical protein
MSTVSNPCHDPPSSEGRAPRARPRLTLSWSLPPAPAPAASLSRLAAQTRRTLEIIIDGTSATASLRADGRQTELARPTPLALVFERENGLWHADAPGLIAATWRERSGRPPEVLFARTPLLEQLGIAGGTAELVLPN